MQYPGPQLLGEGTLATETFPWQLHLLELMGTWVGLHWSPCFQTLPLLCILHAGAERSIQNTTLTLTLLCLTFHVSPTLTCGATFTLLSLAVRALGSQPQWLLQTHSFHSQTTHYSFLCSFFLFFFFKVFSYLTVLGLSCSMLDLCCVMKDLPLQCADSLVVMLRLSSCTGQAPGCYSAPGVLVPQSVIEPESPALQGRFLTTGPPGKSQHPVFLSISEYRAVPAAWQALLSLEYLKNLSLSFKILLKHPISCTHKGPISCSSYPTTRGLLPPDAFPILYRRVF